MELLDDGRQKNRASQSPPLDHVDANRGALLNLDPEPVLVRRWPDRAVRRIGELRLKLTALLICEYDAGRPNEILSSRIN